MGSSVFHIKQQANEYTAERIQNALKEIARILPARAHSTVNTPEFDRIQSRLRTLER